jgi:transposase
MANPTKIPFAINSRAMRNIILQLRPAFVYLVSEMGKSRREVARFFGIRKGTVDEALRRYAQTGSNKNRTGQGRTRTSTDQARVEEVRQLLSRNNRTRRRNGVPASSTRKLANRLNNSRTSVRRILKRDLGLKPYKDIKRQKLTSPQKRMRLEKTRALLERWPQSTSRFIQLVSLCSLCLDSTAASIDR